MGKRLKVTIIGLLACVASGCAMQKSSLESVATGGTGEVWVVVEETQGEKSFGYIVHHCTPTECKAVGTLARVHEQK